MSLMKQTIPCPNCNEKIEFDVQGLLSGEKFNCPSCDASIALGAESKPLVEQTMEKFEDMKNTASKNTNS